MATTRRWHRTLRTGPLLALPLALGMALQPAMAQGPLSPAETEARLRLGYRQEVKPGTILRFETTRGVFRIALFDADAPRMTRALRHLVEDGAFQRAGFWQVQARGVQLGRPDTDLSEMGGRTVRSPVQGAAAMRDADAIPFMATLGAHGFERTGLPSIPGSVLMDQRFVMGGQLFQREVFVALEAGYPRGVVVGHVIEGLDVVRRLTSRDAILDARVERIAGAR